MCIQYREFYKECKCYYGEGPVHPCPRVSNKGDEDSERHSVTVEEVFVAQTCTDHMATGMFQQPSGLRPRRSVRRPTKNGLVHGVTSLPRSRDRSKRSPSRDRLSNPVVAAGLSGAAVAGLYEKRQARRKESPLDERSGGRQARSSTSRSRSPEGRDQSTGTGSTTYKVRWSEYSDEPINAPDIPDSWKVKGRWSEYVDPPVDIDAPDIQPSKSRKVRTPARARSNEHRKPSQSRAIDFAHRLTAVIGEVACPYHPSRKLSICPRECGWHVEGAIERGILLSADRGSLNRARSLRSAQISHDPPVFGAPKPAGKQARFAEAEAGGSAEAMEMTESILEPQSSLSLDTTLVPSISSQESQLQFQLSPGAISPPLNPANAYQPQQYVVGIRPCYILICLGVLSIVGSLAPALWRSEVRHDMSGGFSLAQYILGVGIFVVGSMVAIHSRSCVCWQR